MKPKMFIKSILPALLALILFAGCSGVTSAQTSNCQHDYYLSDYSEPTEKKDGYNEYTCKNCGNSYREVVPATGQDSTETQEDDEADGGISADSDSIQLFDLPIYSEKRCSVDYETKVLDSAGYYHEDCYSLWLSYDTEDALDSYVRYELNGEYSVCSGTIYREETPQTETWLEFYDGDTFLYSTERLTDDRDSISFSFDISGVEYLTVCPRWDPSYPTGENIIADKIIISK